VLNYASSGGGTALLFFIEVIALYLLRSRLCAFLIINTPRWLRAVLTLLSSWGEPEDRVVRAVLWLRGSLDTCLKVLSWPPAVAWCFTDLGLCNTLEREQSAVGLFPQTEKEEAWEERELAAVSALCPALVAVTPQLHHLGTASSAPTRAGAAPAEQKSCRRSW